MPAVLSSSRARRTVSVLRRAHRFGRPAAGDGLILTTTCTSAATPSRSSLLTRPETGRGDAGLWTAAAAPDHRLWTTLRGPLDPSRLPTSPHPTAVACRQRAINHNQSKEDDRPYSGCASPSQQRSTSTSQALTGGPYLNIEVGRSGLSKPLALCLAFSAVEHTKERRRYPSRMPWHPVWTTTWMGTGR
jgi:hypothetical protein